jgi:hypothetical protein
MKSDNKKLKVEYEKSLIKSKWTGNRKLLLQAEVNLLMGTITSTQCSFYIRTKSFQTGN